MNYLAFVIFYSISRILFLLWSFVILRQVFWYPGSNAYPWYAPLAAAGLQSCLFTVNAVFLMTHLKKLGRVLAGMHRFTHEA